jgi:hypothetical protein
VHIIIRGDLFDWLTPSEAEWSYNGCLQAKKLGKIVAALSKNLKASEQERPTM